jgi:hypothetical protein
MAGASRSDDEMMSDNNIDPMPAYKDDTESEYDPFAAETYEDPVMQKCWLILGELFYHYEATDFLEPISAEKFGPDVYEEYCSVIETPMDISTVMERMRSHYYLTQALGDSYRAKEMFRKDVNLIFSNCKEYNESGTEIVRSANTLLTEFKKNWVFHQLY